MNSVTKYFFDLGGILLEAGKCAEAEKIFKEDLKEIPENGWALYGLYEALLKQNNRSEAAEIERRFKEAWKYSDVDLKSSRII